MPRLAACPAWPRQNPHKLPSVRHKLRRQKLKALFGYVTADFNALNPAQQARYRAVYCGLCAQIGRRCGNIARAGVSFDMVFLILVLESMYEPPVTAYAARCPAHPFQKQAMQISEISAYAADLQVLLWYEKKRDDWHDEHRPGALAQLFFLQHAYRRAQRRQPEKCALIRRRLDALYALERAGIPDPDQACALFGALMGELFDYGGGYFHNLLRSFGNALGRLLYSMDAVLDYDTDLRCGRYNPLAGLSAPSEDGFADILGMLAAQCAAEFEKLPLEQDLALMRNVLYSGIWQKYRLKTAKKRENDSGSI